MQTQSKYRQTDEVPWPRIAVLGAGAVGCFFGGMMARCGAPVTLIGRRPLAEAVSQHGLHIDSINFQDTVNVSATDKVDCIADVNIVLLCVKTIDTEEAAKSMLPYIKADTLVLSMQNGMDNVERIWSSAKIEAIPTVVYVSAQMVAPGRVKHTGRGELLVGQYAHAIDSPTIGASELEFVAATFGKAGIPCSVSNNIKTELWTKLVMNCAYNAISALCRSRYGDMNDNPWTKELIAQIVNETCRIAEADGVVLPCDTLVESAWRLGKDMKDAISSTAQDVQRGKLTEIDSLNGYVVKRAQQLGLVAPINQTLHALVKLLEGSLATKVACT